MLHCDVHGGADASTRVVLVHGFTQTRLSWGPVLDAVAASHQVVAVDAPGHGRSARVRADLAYGARLLGEAGATAAYVGYSMGGRLALHLAVAQPELVRRLVLVGATAGIEDPAERAARAEADAALADRIERDGIEAFADAWGALPLFDGQPAQVAAAARAERLSQSPAGLAAALRGMGTGVMPPVWDQLGELRMPVTVLAGERDAKFRALGERLAASVAAGRFETVPGAGHATHLERPDAVADALRRVAGVRPRAAGQG